MPLRPLTHVIGSVQAHDVFAVNLGVKILGFSVVTVEMLGAVGNINSELKGAVPSSTLKTSDTVTWRY